MYGKPLALQFVGEFKSYAEKKPEYARLFTTYQEMMAEKEEELQETLQEEKDEKEEEEKQSQEGGEEGGEEAATGVRSRQLPDNTNQDTAAAESSQANTNESNGESDNDWYKVKAE